MLKGQQLELKFAASGQQSGVDYMSVRTAQEENLNREDPLEFVNWTQVDGIQVSSVNLGSMEECASMILCGRLDLLFPGYVVLDLEMQEYYLISSALSEKLSGGNDRIGLTVEVQGRKLEVLDVIDSEETFLVYETGTGLLVSKIQIPEDMIPAKWSDFGFWVEYGKKMERAFWVLVQTEKRIPDMVMIKEFVGAVWWAGVTGGYGGWDVVLEKVIELLLGVKYNSSKEPERRTKMEDAVKKAIQDITYRTKKFLEEPFQIISENKELAVPYLCSQ